MSLTNILGKQPERGFLVNLNTGEVRSFLLNPETLTERYRANWATPQPFGLSHRRMHYTGGENTEIPLTVYYDQVIMDGRLNKTTILGPLREDQADDVGETFDTRTPLTVDDWRRFLLSLIAPRKGQTISSASPPSVQFYWPDIIDMRVRITEIEFRHTLFKTGTSRARAFFANMRLIEDVGDERIFSEDVRRQGTDRNWASRPI